MSVVKINALEIPPQAGDEIIKRFTARMDSLADVAGFEGFELLRPTGDSEPRWFVYTRWSCLLYTSPSPRDATLSRMPSSA